MRNKILFSFLTILAFLLIHKNAFANPPIPVTVSPSQSLVIYPKNEAPASVISKNDSIISSQIQGTIKSIAFSVGDKVKQGDILATLECLDYDLKVEQIESEIEGTIANIDLLTWQVNRMESLAIENNASKERVKTLKTKLLQTKATLETQKAQLNYAKLQVKRCKLDAPFNGIIIERFSDIGELAVPGTNIIRILDNTQLEVKAHLQPQEVDLLSNTKQIKFIAKAQSYPVKLRVAVDAFDQRTRTQEVRLTFNDKKPLPGSAGRLIWSSTLPHLPTHLLCQVEDKFGIFIVKDDQAEFIHLPEAIEGRPFVIDKNYENIIINGRNRVNIGDKVIATPHEAQ